MSHLPRITGSALLSAGITAALFIGMQGLLEGESHPLSAQELDLTMTHFRPDVETKVRKRVKKQPPEKPQSSQPPAVPRLQAVKNEQIQLENPNEYSNSKSINLLSQTSIPGFSIVAHQVQHEGQGGIKAGIPPVYPPKAVLNNIEGWVLVSITVNQQGQVDQVKVVDSEPARMFEEAAVKAVKKWAFYSKTNNGQSVSYEFNQKIEFKLDQLEETN
ncbi:TonB family protein [Marinicella sediminis]|uniref:Protein TonB n=1 Tax=Marinicella sediminis TaxID=1792834 RepID=A0ABV7J9Q3_9GAMM|nr:energy transducer TonB [Marinicella sediminis]